MYLNFCPYFFGHVGKWIGKKAKFELETYNVTAWETNNSNTHIAQKILKILHI